MITHRIGDATHPTVEGAKIIAHIVNDVGVWGAGFVIALFNRWSMTRELYFDWNQDFAAVDGYEERTGSFALGEVQFIRVQKDITVANMVAQNGLRPHGDSLPLHYPSLALCLEKLATHARKNGASIHMPRIGCGLGGGKWEDVRKYIARGLFGLDVFVYDLPEIRNMSEGSFAVQPQRTKEDPPCD